MLVSKKKGTSGTRSYCLSLHCATYVFPCWLFLSTRDPVSLRKGKFTSGVNMYPRVRVYTYFRIPTCVYRDVMQFPSKS